MDYNAILNWAIKNSVFANSPWHGVKHWKKVSDNAVMLAHETSGADKVVCRLFGILHDFKREREGRDDNHGSRAANSIEKIRNTLLADLGNTQFSCLKYAIANHTRTKNIQEPTVACCFDADRIDLPRVGINIDVDYLSTDAAKKMVNRLGKEFYKKQKTGRAAYTSNPLRRFWNKVVTR